MNVKAIYIVIVWLHVLTHSYALALTDTWMHIKIIFPSFQNFLQNLNFVLFSPLDPLSLSAMCRQHAGFREAGTFTGHSAAFEHTWVHNEVWFSLLSIFLTGDDSVDKGESRFVESG